MSAHPILSLLFEALHCSAPRLRCSYAEDTDENGNTALHHCLAPAALAQSGPNKHVKTTVVHHWPPPKFLEDLLRVSPRTPPIAPRRTAHSLTLGCCRQTRRLWARGIATT